MTPMIGVSNIKLAKPAGLMFETPLMGRMSVGNHRSRAVESRPATGFVLTLGSGLLSATDPVLTPVQGC